LQFCPVSSGLMFAVEKKKNKTKKMRREILFDSCSRFVFKDFIYYTLYGIVYFKHQYKSKSFKNWRRNFSGRDI